METRIIKLTEASIKYGNLNLRPCGKDFFPPDVFGSPNKKSGLGKPITLNVEGFPDPIQTDIPTDSKTGKPRWIFRKRSWLRKFVRLQDLSHGDSISLSRISDRIYNVIPNGKTLITIEKTKKTKHYAKEIEHKIFFDNGIIKIINDDVFSTQEIRNNSIDLIVTSPPYNVDIQYGSYNDSMTYDDYLKFSKDWIFRCYQWLKSGGRLCLNIPLDKNKGGQQSVGADLTVIAKKVGYKYHSTIVWNEGNISRRTAWGSWLSASAPYVIAPVELIVVFYKETWKRKIAGKKSDISREEFMQWTNGLWTFSGESKKKIGHPTPFPVELPKRCIKLFSFVGDTILDPFLGSGSTLIACVLTNRKGVGVEIDKNYCEMAKRRLINEAKVYQLKLI